MDHGLKCSISYVYEWVQQISRKYVYLKLSKYVQVNFALRRFMKNMLYVMDHKGFSFF